MSSQQQSQPQNQKSQSKEQRSSSNKFTWSAPTGGAGHGRCNPNPVK